MRKFIRLLHIQKYLYWNLSSDEYVTLFKNGNRFMLSHSLNTSLKSVVFDINENDIEVIEKEGFEESICFNFDEFYKNIEIITKNHEGVIV